MSKPFQYVFPLHSESQQALQPQATQHPQSLDVPVPGDAKEEPVVGGPHIRGPRGGDDSVKLVESVGGTGRQGSGPPGQGFSKYQKSLPPRFQRQQQVCFVLHVLSLNMEKVISIIYNVYNGNDSVSVNVLY